MFKLISRFTPRLPTTWGRSSTCWCPEEPHDPATKIDYIPNGVRVVTEENLSPLTCVSLFVAVGPRYEPSNLNGITHFIEHIVYKGFETLNKLELEMKLHNIGAKMTVKTRKEMQIFSMIIPSTLAKCAVQHLSQILFELAFDWAEIEKEYYNMDLERIDADNDPKTIIFDYLHAAAFQGTSLAQPVIGPTRNIANFDRCTTVNFFCENYTSNRLVLATSGNIDHNEMMAGAAGSFGHLNEVKYIPDPGRHRFTGSQIVYRDDSMPFAHVAIAFEGPGYNSPDYLKMLVMRCIIGSWHKSQGRPLIQPFLTARAAGSLDACQSYETFYFVYQDVGLWGIYFVAEKWKLDEFIIYVQEALMEMSIMSHDKEVERGINLAKLKIAKRYVGVVNSTFDIGTQIMYTDTRWSYMSHVNQLNRIDAKSIKAAGEKYLYGRSPVVVGIGPTETLLPYNRIQSGMYWLRF